MVRSVG
jgi:hypothetical protein